MRKTESEKEYRVCDSVNVIDGNGPNGNSKILFLFSSFLCKEESSFFIELERIVLRQICVKFTFFKDFEDLSSR